MSKLVFIDKVFEPYRLQLNELRGIPAEGKNGYYAHNGKERTDGLGKTMNYIMAFDHPITANKWCINKLDGLPQNIIDDADHELSTREEEIADGWIEEVGEV